MLVAVLPADLAVFCPEGTVISTGPTNVLVPGLGRKYRILANCVFGLSLIGLVADFVEGLVDIYIFA